MAICSEGKEGKDGICKYLVKCKDAIMGCKLILKGKIPSRVGFQKGCHLRTDETLWCKIEELYKPKLENKFSMEA